MRKQKKRRTVAPKTFSQTDSLVYSLSVMGLAQTLYKSHGDFANTLPDHIKQKIVSDRRNIRNATKRHSKETSKNLPENVEVRANIRRSFTRTTSIRFNRSARSLSAVTKLRKLLNDLNINYKIVVNRGFRRAKRYKSGVRRHTRSMNRNKIKYVNFATYSDYLVAMLSMKEEVFAGITTNKRFN